MSASIDMTQKDVIVFENDRMVWAVPRVPGDPAGAIDLAGKASFRSTGKASVRLPISAPLSNFVNVFESRSDIGSSSKFASPTGAIFVQDLAKPSGIFTFQWADRLTVEVQCQVFPSYVRLSVGSLTGSERNQVKKLGIVDLQLDAGYLLTNRYRLLIYPSDIDPTNDPWRRVLGYIPLAYTTTIPQSLSHLQASSYFDNGLGSIDVALVTCPLTDWLLESKNIEEAYPLASSASSSLPSPVVDTAYGINQWAKTDPFVKSSYLFVDLSYLNHEYLINCAHRGGFRCISIYQDSWSESAGTYAVKTSKYSNPKGLEDLKKVAQAARSHGLEIGLHVLSASVAFNDPLLGADSGFAPVGGHNDPFFYPNNTDLNRVAFPDLGVNPGDIKSNLKQIVANVAATFTYIKATFIYLDGIEQIGNAYPEYRDVAMAIVASEYLTGLGGAFLQSSESVPFLWHAQARAGTTDRARIAIRDFMDRVKVKTYSEAIGPSLFMPRELGWIGLFAKIGRSTDDSFASTTLEDIEYQLNKSLMFDLPISLETSALDMQTNALTDLILDRINIYEEARFTRAIPHTALQYYIDSPGKEFYLVKRGETFGLLEREYQEHYFAGPVDFWMLHPVWTDIAQMKIVPYRTPPSGIRENAFGLVSNQEIHDLFELEINAEEVDPNAPTLKATYDDYKTPQLSKDDVVCALNPLKLIVINNNTLSNVRVSGTRNLPEISEAEAKLGVSYHDLRNHKAIGARTKIVAPAGLTAPIITIRLRDFTGAERHYSLSDDGSPGDRQCFIPSMTEYIDGGESNASVLDFEYSDVRKIGIDINHIPPGTTTIDLSDIVALWQQPLTVQNPTISINGAGTVTFETTLEPVGGLQLQTNHKNIREMPSRCEPWEYLVFDPYSKTAVKYDGNHSPVAEVAVRFEGLGKIPTGPLTMRYDGKTSTGDPADRAVISVLSVANYAWIREHNPAPIWPNWNSLWPDWIKKHNPAPIWPT